MITKRNIIILATLAVLAVLYVKKDYIKSLVSSQSDDEVETSKDPK